MPGIFSLGIDVELAWGFVHRNNINLARMREISINVRKVLDDLLELLERYEISATWNILGHLILDHCEKENPKGLPHDDMPRPRYTWLNCDWYRYDPCTNISKDPAWYGKDIVDSIVRFVKTSKVPHEIGCHSFSHQQFGDSGCNEELARAEVEKCIELMKTEYDLIPETFAFPRDYVGNLAVLKEEGFTSFRDIPSKLYPCLKQERTASNFLKTQLSLAIQLLSYYFLFPPHVVLPREVISGLWGTRACLAYGQKPGIPQWLVTLKAKQGINKAIRDEKVFTMYIHLRDFGAHNNFIHGFEKVLEFVSHKRGEDKLVTRTMSELSRGFNV